MSHTFEGDMNIRGDFTPQSIVRDPGGAQIPRIRTQADMVDDLKARAGKCLEELSRVMDDALDAGFAVRWAGIGINQMTRRHEALDVHLEKRY